MIHLSHFLSNELKEIIDPVIQRNGYFGHPDNILLTKITDERKHIRELGTRRILKARSEIYGLRRFSIPELRFDAKNYINLIDWQTNEITEPSLIAEISEHDIEMVFASRNVPLFEFPKYPCHTQAVERCVKLATEESAAVCGSKPRDGFIRVRLDSRKRMPYFNKKADYRTSSLYP